MHGCRQLVSCDVRLSPATSATPLFSRQHIMVGTLNRLPGITGRKVGMMSSQYVPYTQGYTRVTMDGTKSSNSARRSQSLKLSPVQIEV